jgi:hypothetical protein
MSDFPQPRPAPGQPGMTAAAVRLRVPNFLGCEFSAMAGAGRNSNLPSSGDLPDATAKAATARRTPGNNFRRGQAMRLTRKIEYLARSFTHWVREGLAARGIGLTGSYPIFTRWNAARMLVMAALLSGGAVMYFNLAPEGAGKTEALPQIAESRSVRGDPSWMRSLNNDDEWR